MRGPTAGEVPAIGDVVIVARQRRSIHQIGTAGTLAALPTAPFCRRASKQGRRLMTTSSCKRKSEHHVGSAKASSKALTSKLRRAKAPLQI